MKLIESNQKYVSRDIVYFKVCTIPVTPCAEDLRAILRSPVASVLQIVLALPHAGTLSCASLRAVSLPRNVAILFTHLLHFRS